MYVLLNTDKNVYLPFTLKSVSKTSRTFRGFLMSNSAMRRQNRKKMFLTRQRRKGQVPVRSSRSR
jgi:hypothetical protein